MGIGERVVSTCSNPVKKAQLIKTTCLPKQCFVRNTAERGRPVRSHHSVGRGKSKDALSQGEVIPQR